MEILLYIMVLFLTVLGLSDVIHNAYLLLYRVKDDKSKIVCCVLHDEKSELSLKAAIEQYSWLGRKYADRLYAINCFKENCDTLERCKRIALHNGIQVISADGFIDILKTEY